MLTQGKDNNTVQRKKDRKDESVLKLIDYIHGLQLAGGQQPLQGIHRQ